MPSAPAWQRWLDRRGGFAAACLLTAALWAGNLLWLARDTRPPVWDMALHQSYALNYLPGAAGEEPAIRPWARSGNYPPFVHLVIAALFALFHPDPRIAALANLPATFILLWSVHELAEAMAGRAAARWAAFITAFAPYMVWMSRETILDYWMSAWVAAALLALWKSDGFADRRAALAFGCAAALGMLTKWLFAGFLLLPLAYVALRHRLWHHADRMVHKADAILIAGIGAGLWYVPNLPGLVRYFGENMRIGAREGEPPVLSFQSLIYYLRLLEGYQFFGILFALTAAACWFAWRRQLIRDGRFLAVAIAGGWLAMTLLRTKDPRFTMPLLGLLAIVCGAWVASWGYSRAALVGQGLLAALLLAQAYAVSFGVAWLPQQVVLARGYQGSLRWDWNLYTQHYFHILGKPRREDWKLGEILDEVRRHSHAGALEASLAIVPDLPRFNAASFTLEARLSGMSARIDHPQSAAAGVGSFDGFNYALMTEGEQGMPWTTVESPALNRIIMDEHGTFLLLGIWVLPNGDSARLYFVRRETGGE